jgi:hypothetical protein
MRCGVCASCVRVVVRGSWFGSWPDNTCVHVWVAWGVHYTCGSCAALSSLEAHVIEIEAVGPGDPPFTVNTVRHNPAKPGAVTGNATYASFLSSMVRACGHGPGIHFC